MTWNNGGKIFNRIKTGRIFKHPAAAQLTTKVRNDYWITPLHALAVENPETAGPPTARLVIKMDFIRVQAYGQVNNAKFNSSFSRSVRKTCCCHSATSIAWPKNTTLPGIRARHAMVGTRYTGLGSASLYWKTHLMMLQLLLKRGSKIAASEIWRIGAKTFLKREPMSRWLTSRGNDFLIIL